MNVRRLWRVAAVVAALTMSWQPRVFAAAPPELDMVDVEVAESVVDTANVRTWASEAAADGLSSAGISASNSDGRRLTVQIGGTPYKYDVTIGVVRDGTPLGTAKTTTCECDEDQLVAQIRRDVEAIAPRLRGEDDGSTSTTVPSGPPSTPTREDSSPRVPLGNRGKAGVALLVVGGAASFAGIGLLAVGKQTDRTGDLSQLRDRDFRIPGASVLAVGVVAVIVGAALLGVDRRDARAKRRVARAGLVPVVGRGRLGLVFTTRF